MEMIPTIELVQVLRHIISFHDHNTDWVFVRARLPSSVLESMRLAMHLFPARSDRHSSIDGAEIAEVLGGADMRVLYNQSSSDSRPNDKDKAMQRVMDLMHRVDYVSPAKAAALVLVCSPLNARSTVRELDWHYDVDSGRKSSTPEG